MLFKKLNTSFQHFILIDALSAYICIPSKTKKCLGGGIGRRAGLKIRWQRCRKGSSPFPGTSCESRDERV